MRKIMGLRSEIIQDYMEKQILKFGGSQALDKN